MPVISDDEQRSDRAKSWLPKGLRRQRAMAMSPLLPDVRHRLRRRSSLLLRRRSQRGPPDFSPGLLERLPDAEEEGAGALPGPAIELEPVVESQDDERVPDPQSESAGTA
jgi:hypothetical protein